MLFGKLHNKLLKVFPWFYPHKITFFYIFCRSLSFPKALKVPLLEGKLRIFEDPYLQRKSRLRRKGNCGELQEFTQMLHLPAVFHISKHHF